MLYEFEQELFGGLPSRPAVRPRVRIRYVHGAGELEFEAFDPSLPRRGTRTIPGFAVGVVRRWPVPGGGTVDEFVRGAELTAAHRQRIDQIAREIVIAMWRSSSAKTIVIEVEGHEDETGDPVLFHDFGRRRATAVAQALAERLTAQRKKMPSTSQWNVDIRVSSAGPTRPIRSNVTASGRALNRRVEIRWHFVDRTI
jgi:hypothetical protein